MSVHSPAATEPQVMQPMQARSRATMERIVAAAEDLLTARPFDQITIAQISAQAGCAPTAIYARFSDKNALLLELHRRFQERTAGQILALVPDVAADLDAVISDAATQLVHLYRRHRGLLRAVLLSDNATMYERSAELTRVLSTRLAALAAPGEPADGVRAREVDFGVRCALALLQQELLYGPVTPTLFEIGDTLVPRIVGLLRAAICEAATARAPE